MRRIIIIAALAALAAAVFAGPAGARTAGGCQTKACEKRVAKKAKIHRLGFPMCNTWACTRRVARARHGRLVRQWRRVAVAYRGWLASTSFCESGHHGHYRLRTTGNGFYFAFQFTPSTWASVGGRIKPGFGPVGYRGEAVPTRAEQDFRAVRVLHSQGAGAWPNCG